MYHKAQQHFKRTDPILYRASLAHKIDTIKVSDNIFRDLVRAIASQQLSGKAADTIFGRLEKLLGKKKFIAPHVLNINDGALRECGFSNAKIIAIKSLAQAVEQAHLNLTNIHHLQDDEVITTLTKVKGIGPWTAEMILMFSLGREDIFSTGDLGLQKGIMYIYGLRKLPSQKKMVQLSKSWAPYRTYAAKILWRVADENKIKKVS